MIDVAEAIDAESVAVLLKRRAAATFDQDGEAVPGAETTVGILAAVQPMSLERYGGKLKDMPEGFRVEDLRMVWSRTEIRLDDAIVHKGKSYRVVLLWDRDDEGGFYRAAMGLLK